jgi:hypothetical protein
MATAAQSIILRAQTTLQDVSGVRWPADELVRYLNDGQREIVRLRPDQKAASVTMSLVEGYRQTISPDHAALIDVPANASGRFKRITKVDLALLDSVEPTWRSKPAASEIVHFCHDLREPRVFYVYPPAQSGLAVEAVVSVYPTDVAAPNGATFASVSGDIDLPDQWADALLNYVLFRAYSKDAEFGGNAALSAAYLQRAQAILGVELQSSAVVAPTS